MAATKAAAQMGAAEAATQVAALEATMWAVASVTGTRAAARGAATQRAFDWGTRAVAAWE